MKIKSLFLLLSSTLMFRAGVAMVRTHFKCRGGLYPLSSVQRFAVPDDKVSWGTEFNEYQPSNFTSPTIFGKPWADPEIGEQGFKPQWNAVDGGIDRTSYTGEYEIVDNHPLNPVGRTGITGRGVLGRWGPNHAADSVVTRWKKNEKGELLRDSDNRRILQFITIKRSDSGDWSLPGGMVDPGEKVGVAAMREFQEEATNYMGMSEAEKKSWLATFEDFFSGGEEVYRGYVDDRRNTDNSWMETVAYNFHDEGGDAIGSLRLQAGDDAVGVRWADITPDLQLYANHKSFVDETLKRRLAVSP